jgi:hypothetical protein
VAGRSVNQVAKVDGIGVALITSKQDCLRLPAYGPSRSQTSCIGAAFRCGIRMAGRVSFIEDDWYDDFPLVWRGGWFSTTA